ncbi:trans-4-hydroxy-L-proline dehydratase [Candidatus Neomarinimicrobiota bacterium]
MNERIKRLRERSLAAQPCISLERAQLITHFYTHGELEKYSAPVARALVFRHLMEHKEVFIGKDELIVGERGPEPKATSTYPEICCHSLQDFTTLDQREHVRFVVDAAARRVQEKEIIPYWTGRSMRDRIFASVSNEWQAAYEAGVFTEFMEQRAPGHAVLDDKIYHRGMLDLQREILASIDRLDYQQMDDAFARREQLRAMDIAAEGLMVYARRHADRARELAAREPNPRRKGELEEIARVCAWVPAQAPESFREALQHYWFVHLGVITELNPWDGYSPGRLDQHLLPFYRRDLEAGRLTEEQARELLAAFWIKFNNHPAPPKVGITAQESATYTDFCLINLGGVTADGEDGVNQLSYMMLDVIEELRLTQPSTAVQISEQSPDAFLERALGIIKTGYGQPSVFNTEAIVGELTRQARTLEDARNGGAQGCVEVSAFGKEACILTGYFNLCKVLEITLHNGTDPRTGQRIGLETGDPREFATFDDLIGSFDQQLKYFIDIKLAGNLVVERFYAEELPAPFLSLLTADCIAKAMDYNAGGARYNSSYVQGVGLGSLTDSLSAIKHHVFDGELAMDQLLDALAADFAGHEDLRQRLRSDTPRWGNDDHRADDLAVQVFELFYRAVDSRPTWREGGRFRINLLPTTSHVYFGSVIGALPEGRPAGEPLSEGISPVQGTDRDGPTAVMKSCSKIDHLRTGGTLLNQKFLPQVLEDPDGLRKVGQLIRVYFSLNGHHVQFNVVTVETLRKAQQHPEKYRDLIVRVAGYSDYFVDLEKELQDEIIKRTAHSAD